jgi:hypothetical protein
MSRQTRIGLITGGVLLLALVGIIAFLLLPKEPQTISKATSPDGAWSVEVVATPHLLSGSYDIVVYFVDGRGNRLPGGMTVDVTRDLTAAKTRHAVTFVDDRTAKVGSHTLEKPNAIGK